MPFVIEPTKDPNRKLFIGLIVVFVMCVVAYLASTAVIKKLIDARDNPWIIEGVREAKKPLILSQDVGADGSKPILRSKNEDDGIEASMLEEQFLVYYQFSL